MQRIILAVCLLIACSNSKGDGTTLTIANRTTADTTVYVSFGADSAITANDWGFCTGSGLTCNFVLPKQSSRLMTNPKGLYTNATFAFGQAVGCGATKAETNINNPKWYDILDVSLVDGFSNKVQINAVPTKGAKQQFGPVSQTGNENMLGVFPYGCDICVERQNPPCGISKGKDGCKAGTQYDPKPPCQWQGPTKGGGDLAVTVALVP